jgi:ATP-dependent RNA helicase DDX52/ROK1
MEELFNFLSSSARFDKSKRGKKRQREQPGQVWASNDKDGSAKVEKKDDDSSDEDVPDVVAESSRDRTGKRDTSEAKQIQVHQEQVSAFRRSMSIRVANKHDTQLPDPVSSFEELPVPTWWSSTSIDPNGADTFRKIFRVIQRNVEIGRWKEPTPIQMQGIPALMERRDLIGAAPTGSGKSGAFIIPALLLSSAPYHIYYNAENGSSTTMAMSKKQKRKKNISLDQKGAGRPGEGEIRALILAPSHELAVQLHREVERLGNGKPGGISSLLLSKSNVAHVIQGTAGGKHGLDVLISTPMRLVDAIRKGVRLDTVRLVVLDEADRLLDAADGNKKDTSVKMKKEEEESDDEGGERVKAKAKRRKETATEAQPELTAHGASSGSAQTQTFLEQMDTILSSVPSTAVRALFSATVTPTVRSMAESVLRNPIDLKIAGPGSVGGANTDIQQTLTFVGREEGKLLAIRQLVQRGEIKPPAIVFVQSQERAQALFGELLYDGIHVDVIHAGRSKAARDNAVARFRKGDTWVLICTDLVARGVDFRAVNMVINYDLPSSGITYVHRIGRTGRAGRKGQAITLFTEADFDNLRTIANVMKQSGCEVEDWMLQLRKKQSSSGPLRRADIETTPLYDKRQQKRRKQMIIHSKNKKNESS